MKRLRTLISLVLAVVLCMGMVSPAFAAVALNKDEHIDKDTGELKSHKEDEKESYDYYLENDITLDKTLIIKNGVDANIDLNGHKLQLNEHVKLEDAHQEGYYSNISWQGGKSGSVIKVTGEGSSLAIMDKAMDEGADSRGEETGVITGAQAAGISVEAGGELTLNGGKITQNANRGVDVNAGTFNMTGGIICDNKQNATGGGVGVYYGGTFNMSGGEITHNWTGSSGGGVSITTDSTFNMSGGKISDNRTGMYGGGVFVSPGTFNLSGGEISGNKTVKDDANGTGAGGGVYVRNGGTVNMTGGKITQNTSFNYGGGIGAGTSTGKGGILNISGGEIAENAAKSGEGAIVKGSYTNNGYTISVDGEGNITIIDAEGESLDVIIDSEGNTISAEKLPEGATAFVFDGVLSFPAPVVPEEPENPIPPVETPNVPDSGASEFIPASGASGTTAIENQEVPLAGLVSRGALIAYLYVHEGSPDGEDAEGEYTKAMAWAAANDIADGDADPEEIVTAAMLRDVLTRYARFLDAAFTLEIPGEDDALVMNCDEILEKFFEDLEKQAA